MKKVLSIVLCFILVFGCLPMTVLAEEYVTITVTADPCEVAQNVAGGGTYHYGDTVELFAPIPNYNYVFLGWAENGNIIEVSRHMSFTARTNRTLVAVFERNYSVKIKHGDEIVRTIFATKGEHISISPYVDESKGERFEMWTDVEGITLSEAELHSPQLEINMPANDVSLTARIAYESEIIPEGKHTLTLNGDSTVVYSDVTSKVLPSDLRDGNKFLGWAESADGYVKYKAGDTVVLTSDLTLYAKWRPVEENEHLVTVTKGTGSDYYAEGDSVTITANDPKPGKVFDKWIGAEDLTFTEGDVTSAKATFTMPQDNVTLTATWKDDVGYASIKSASASFDEELRLNYYIDIPESLRDGSYAVITCGDDSERIDVSDADDYETMGFKFSYPLLAQQIDDDVNIKLYDKDNGVITLKNTSGSHDYTDSGIDYSIRKYVDYMISNGSETMQVLAQAAKDYCYAAKNQFTGSACPLSSAVDKVTLDDLDKYVSKRDGTMPSGVSYSGISALFGSDNSFRLYLKFKGVDPKDLSFKLNGNDTSLKTSGNQSYLTFTSIVSTKLDEEHTFTISDGNSTYELTVSVLTYARAVVGQSNSDTMVSLAKSLYLYSEAAHSHFKTN